MTVIRLITVTPAVNSRSTMRPLDTVGGRVLLGTKMPSSSPATTNSSWLRPTRSRRWRLVNRLLRCPAVRRAWCRRVNRRPGCPVVRPAPDGLVWATLPPLLAQHRQAHLAFGVGDEIAGQVDRGGVQGAGEPERRAVVRGDGRARVGAAGQAARIEGDGGGDRDLGLGDQLAVDVELGPARSAHALGDVGFPGGLELEAQLMAACGHRVG